jgi:PKD repeat protein
VFTSVTIDPAIGEIPLTVSLSATATSATSFKWQKLVGVVWTDIASTQTTTYSVTTAAVHQFRAIATGPGGTTTSSVVSVNAGGKPIISITEPLYNSIHASNISMTLSASIVGADSFNWNFGDDTAVGDTTANPTTVIYSAFGSKTIVLTATNIYGTVTDTVVISIGSASSRPFATGTIAPVSTQTLDNLTDEFHVSAGEFPDPVNIFFAISAPYEDIIGAFFMLFVFGVIFIMLWLITKNVTVPCIIGIIFGAFILLYLPDGYYGPAIAIMAISITGGVIRVFMPPK